jgi:hypothetical protein
VRTKIISFLLCVFLLSPLYAQHFKGGVLAGINASQVDGDNQAGYNKLGVMAGAFVIYPVSANFDFQLEMKYMGKGAKKKTTANDLSQYTSSLNYIDIPVLLRLNTKIKLGWEMGLSFNYLFSSSEKDEYGNLPAESSMDFKPFELSYLIGVKYDLTTNWSAGLRYSYSLLSIVNDSRAYNNLFSLGLYLKL